MTTGLGDVGDIDGARDTTLFERGNELRLIELALGAASSHDGRLLLFEGPAGIGKTALLQQTRADALATGSTAPLARGSEFERGFPYAVVRQLLEPPMRAAGERDGERLLAGAAQFAAPVVLPDSAIAQASAGADGFAVLNGLYWLAVNLSADSPLVLIVDDIQWADTASLQFLLFLARRIEGLAISIVASRRVADGEAADAGLLDELTTVTGALRMTPAALSSAGVAEMLRPLFGREPEGEFTLRCHTATGGNPLLVRELAKVLVDDGVTPDANSQEIVANTGPETVARAALRRLERLSADAVGLARALAVLGRDATLGRAAALCEFDEQRALTAQDLLVGAGFVEVQPDVEFVHPVIRAAIYNALAPGERTLTHRRIAELLVSEGAELDMIAGHLLLSQPVGSQETAETLHRAATHAFALGLPANAATYLTRALEENPAGELRATMLFELGLALKISGDLAGAIEQFERAAAFAESPAVRVRAVVEASTMRVYSGDWDGPFEAIAGALAGLGEQDCGLLMQTEGSLTAMLGYDERLVARLDARLGELHELAERGGTAAAPLLMSLAGIGALRGEPNELARARVTRAWDGGAFLGVGDALELLPQGAYALVISDELALLEEVAATVQSYAVTRGSLMSFLTAATYASSLETRRGQLVVAEAELRIACESALEHGYLFALPTMLWGGTEVLVERESAADLAMLVEDVDPAQLPNSFNAAVLYWVRGRMRFVAGDRAAANSDLRDAGRLFDALRFTNPNATPWRSTLALMLGPDEREQALELVYAELGYARPIGQPRAIGTALSALGTITGGDEGIAQLQQAVELLARSPARLEHARALVALGAALRRGRARSAARAPLLEGLELAARCGAERLVEHAREELAAAGARPRRLYQTSRDALTPSQLRVAEMAAQGRSTKDIAQALFVTTRTIDAHLQHAYAKLGINSRKQLREALARDGSAPE